MIVRTDQNDGQNQPDSKSQSLRHWVDRVTLALNVLGSLLIVAVMVLVNADVIGRGAFGLPISGVPEMVSLSIVAIVFLQVAQTFKMGRLTRSDALMGAMQRRAPRMRAAVELIFCIGAGGIMLQLLIASWPLFVKAWKRNTFEGTIGDFTAPIWPVKMIILIGCTALIIQLIYAGKDAITALVDGKVDKTGKAGGADEQL